MKTRYLFLRFFFGSLMLFHFSLIAQNQFTIDEVLQKKLEKISEKFNGDVAIYVHHLPTNKVVSILADEVFPTASMIKVPILIGVFNKIEKGELTYNGLHTYKDSLRYEGDDILGSFKENEKITLSKLMMLMITMSDNTASLWNQLLAGTGTEINSLLEQYGFKSTRVNSRTFGREMEKEKYGWGQTSAHEMVKLFELIANGKIINNEACEEMIRILGNIYWNGEALSQIPPYIKTISKQGAVSQSRSETVLVYAPSGTYVFCVITKNQKDESWEYSNEGFVLIRTVSNLLWNYFEPKSNWKPTIESEKWFKE